MNCWYSCRYCRYKDSPEQCCDLISACFIDSDRKNPKEVWRRLVRLEGKQHCNPTQCLLCIQLLPKRIPSRALWLIGRTVRLKVAPEGKKCCSTTIRNLTHNPAGVKRYSSHVAFTCLTSTSIAGAGEQQ
jgi:hypothetical protein